jgi:hypothetical protein
VPPEPHESLKLWQRLVFAAMGIGALAGGSLATFITTNSVGSGVFLALGAVFSLIAVTGNPISRAKFGDNEVTFGLRRAVGKVLSSQEPDARTQLAEAVVDIPLAAEDPIRVRAAQLRYSADLLSAFQSIGAVVVQQPSFVTRSPDGHERLTLDAVATYGTKSLGIEIVSYRVPNKDTTRLLRFIVREALEDFRLEGRRLDGFVIVSPEALPIYDIEEFRGNVRTVVWRSPLDNPAIKTALVSIPPLEESD